ncbi:hypothetical protein B7P43_G17806 [Cryptotermes secundus]|uniref:Uncharacterized protein n=1 Tax=Cryptotermes secundus TaxID=105785 RepID=A0A2J7PIQ8_9NEOP|nr:hypothetical protein B7P43_G17806 [Cryptotermes secundus]
MSRNQMETLDIDAQRRELLFSQAYDNVLREQSLLSAWHQAAFPSNSQQSNNKNNNNNNNNKKNLSPRYGKISGNQDGARDRYFKGNRNSNGHPWGPTRLPRIQTSSNNNNNNSNSSSSPFSPASDLRRLLRSTNQSPEIPTREHSVKNSRGDDQAETDFNGPYNFRQLLRPTEHLPTESLRKRKGILMGERTSMPHTSVTPPNHPDDDSPSKRRAKPVHPRKI